MGRLELEQAVSRVPSGGWAIGVSGGADSVALLRLAHCRADLQLVVVHLDHETRSGQSAADAAFVAELAESLGVACVLQRRSQVERQLVGPPANVPARFRACRMRLFADVVQDRGLAGVLLAHHAGDQAETVFQRLVRGSGPLGLAGMSVTSTVGGLTIHRPLLGVRGACLRAFLDEIGQPWREDASNQSDRYQRNRVRRALARQPALQDRLIELSAVMQTLRRWVRAAAPRLGQSISAVDIDGLPPLVADQALRLWLADQGVPGGEIAPAVVERLREMLADAASPARQHFPSGILLHRRRGLVSV